MSDSIGVSEKSANRNQPASSRTIISNWLIRCYEYSHSFRVTGSSPVRQSLISTFRSRDRRSKLEINKRHRACCRKKFERQKRQHVCRDLNACGLQREPINELIAFLRDRQEQRNEKEHDCSSC